MSWDQKGRSGPYFYRSVRVDGQVRKVYVGRGEQAEAAARQLDERRQSREAVHQEQLRVTVAEQRLRDLRDVVAVLVRAALLGEGYHQHHGSWRRRRCHGRPH